MRQRIARMRKLGVYSLADSQILIWMRRPTSVIGGKADIPDTLTNFRS